MKKLILLLIPSLLVAAPSQIGSITLAWDPSPDTGVAGYKIYASTNNFTSIATNAYVGTNLMVTLDHLTPGTWYFAATAIGTNTLESEFSNVVIAAMPNPPANMRTVIMQYGTTITNYTDVGFFRIRIE